MAEGELSVSPEKTSAKAQKAGRASVVQGIVRVFNLLLL